MPAQPKQLGQAIALAIQRTELAHRLAVVRLALQQVAVEPDRAHVVVQVAGGDLRRAVQVFAPQLLLERQRRCTEQQRERTLVRAGRVHRRDQLIERKARALRCAGLPAGFAGATQDVGRAVVQSLPDRNLLLALGDVFAREVRRFEQRVEIAAVALCDREQRVAQPLARRAPLQVGERAQRRHVLAVGGHRQHQRGLGRVFVLALDLVPARDACVQLARELALGRIVGRELLREGRRQLVPAARVGRGGLEQREQLRHELVPRHAARDHRARRFAEAPELGRDARRRRRQLDAALCDRRRLHVRLECGLVVAQPLLVHLGFVMAQLGHTRRAFRQARDRIAVCRDHRVPRPEPFGQTADAALDRAVVGRERERASQARERRARVAGALLVQGRGFDQTFGLHRRRARDRQPRFEQIEQVLPITGALIGVRERGHGAHSAARIAEQRLLPAQRGFIARVDLQRRCVAFGRELGLIEPLAIGITQARLQLGEARDLARGRVAQHVGELSPAFGTAEQLGQRRDRLGVLSELGCDSAPHLDRRVGIVQAIGVRAGEPGHVLAAPAAAAGGLHATLEQAREPLPRLLFRGGGDQRFERFEILCVFAQARLPGLFGAPGIAEPFGELGDPAEQRAARHRFALELAQAAQRLQRLHLASRLFEQRHESASGLDHVLGRRRRVEHALVQRAGTRRVADHILFRVRRVEQQLRGGRRVIARLGGFDQRRREQFVIARALGQRAQRVALARDWLEHDQLRLELDRARVFAELDQAIAQLAQQRAALGAFRVAQPELDHAHDLLRLACVDQVLAQDLLRLAPRFGARAVGGENALEHVVCGVVIRSFGEHELGLLERLAVPLQLVEVTICDAHARLARLFRRLHRQARLPQRDQIGPALLALEQALEAARQRGIVGIERVQLEHVADRAIGRIREVLGDLRRFLEQAHATRGLIGARDCAVVRVEQLLPALGRGVRDRQALERPLRLRVAREHVLEPLAQLLAVFAVPGFVEAHAALPDVREHVRCQALREHVAEQRAHVIGPLRAVEQLFHALPARAVFWILLHRGYRGSELVLALALGLIVGHGPLAHFSKLRSENPIIRVRA